MKSIVKLGLTVTPIVRRLKSQKRLRLGAKINLSFNDNVLPFQSVPRLGSGF